MITAHSSVQIGKSKLFS